ncbi:class C sortase [Homoserinibacter sp. GY 40078]|uniref:class C sortase n=1 Tax=Homoserinibacter sp. GY 40078 TaxID=2603275 RepID=UPI0011CA1AF1|nr:class C sortase [Homoserinibacter sp. GY 40078]TXK19161.1 class C sortase [Homoserinibacter sp. GY 40078]
MTAAPVLAPFPRRERRSAVRPRSTPASLVAALVLLTGSALLLYPTVAAWISDRIHASVISGYVDDISGSAPSRLTEQLDSAREYNSTLPDGPLRDPYLLNADGTAGESGAQWNQYLRELDLDPNGPMARIRIPSIDVDLPIYHGTDSDTLEQGVGHLYGSSLPVGGIDTNSVLAGHSGLPSAPLFTGLHDIAEGAIVEIDVMGDTLTYLVTSISVVEPNDGSSLRRVMGKDVLTLVTCTPIGVNSHRIIVRAERAGGGEDLPTSAEVELGTDPGVPWWIVPLLAAVGAALWVAWPRTRASLRAARHRARTVSARGAGTRAVAARRVRGRRAPRCPGPRACIHASSP